MEDKDKSETIAIKKKVGKCVPPAEYNIKKGQVLNPTGRPKGSKNIKATLLKYLDKCVQASDFDGQAVNLTAYDAIALAAIKKGLEGDLNAIDKIYDRLEGKAKQPIEDVTKSLETDEKILEKYGIKLREPYKENE